MPQAWLLLSWVSHGKASPCFSPPCPLPSREEDSLAGGKCLIAALPNSRLSAAWCRCARAGDLPLQAQSGSASASRGRASLGRQACTLRGPSGLAPIPTPEEGDKGCSGLLPKSLSHPYHGEPRHSAGTQGTTQAPVECFSSVSSRFLAKCFKRYVFFFPV